MAAYQTFDSIAEAKESFRRVRKRRYFVISDAGVEMESEPCFYCNRPLSDDPATRPGWKGNRCQYIPKAKKVIAMHYQCCIGSVLGNVS